MKKLLFVEDDMVIGCIYRHHFAAAGYEVELAEDGEKALAALARFQPNIVVLDLLLPKVNGVEILKRIRSTPGTASLPVIVFTSAFASDLAREAERAGATRCLSKAQTGAVGLLEAVRSALAAEGASQSPRAGLGSGTPNRVLGRVSPGASLPAELDAQKEYLKHAPRALDTIRRLSQRLLSESAAAAQATLVLELEIAVHSLTSSAGLADAHTLANIASALDVFLKELYEKPKHVNASTVRTVHQCAEFLGEVFQRDSGRLGAAADPSNILIVDDDPIALKAVSAALSRAQLRGVSVEDPYAAFELLRKESFQLAIFDVMMPGMDGFELCQKMRGLPGNANTPVIFVTALDDFSARIRSAQSGGTDFIGKPFSLMELAVKALMHLLNGKLSQPGQTAKGFQPLVRTQSA